ncbi:ABC-type antimicrobial peptide transport system, permease component [Chitinophaga ginsengisegetis]|uniref:ABC-type antimicrobial peptide transport system, permease component n=1 Tax=Chitinophaga ginsengisegetis TaxID=393003 RepID=A0A1T5PCN7_9BACT|nr:ABC transporter permease [Chitinophaga ginsengisegetis]SKD10495.1 ABC-type antimicrobial peptide transport system, permease component [Chitinophaga ginsengisegetis]
MKEQREHHPPSWAQRFVEWYCKPGLVEDLTGDLHECFERNVQSMGPRRAKLIYIIDAFKFFRSYTVRSSLFVNLFTNRIMIGSYVKTSGRNIMRNKLFSFINILGLAISMSVGLLLIAFVLDLRSYDRFHKNGERIYRITNVLTSKSEDGGKFASTSIKTGRLIREKVTGIEEVAIMRNDFSGDAKVGDNILPIKGFWAEPSFFRIFTFPMVEGNAATALKDPYSVVLTETAARKLFGNQAAVGKTVKIDTLAYQVTGIMKDVPFFSHISFEALVSLSTAEQINKGDNHFAAWTNMWSNSVYILPSENADMAAIRSQLNALAREENLAEENTKIQLELLPLYNIVVGESLRQSEGGPGFTGPHVPRVVLWILGGLAFVVILSACFNYTNLSIARAMRRIKEIGLRKAIGAGKSQVRLQFLAEAVMISLAALLLSFLLFLVLRPVLINMAPEMQRTVKLNLTPAMVAAFIVFSVAVGIIAGFLPAIFFSKVSPMSAFGNVSSVKMFKHLTLRRSLVVIQYTVTLIFITTTAVGYVQYKNILAFDLGFKTANILNINMQDNKPDVLMKELSEMPEVTALSRSLITTGVGNAWGGNMKYKDSRDSVLVMTNHIDENYLPLHDYKLLAGGNFVARPVTAQAVGEVIVNQQVLKRFNIGGNNPEKAIGEQITLNGRKMTIVGVMQDFHYGKVENLIGPVAFTFWTPEDRAIISARIQSSDMPATVARIESIWKKIDRVHPFMAEFYDKAIEDAYSEFSTMIKIIGFLSFLAISIASMGLFGMVVFTTETRLKEIGIRKVMGASDGNLIYLLSRGFLLLLSVSALIALPVTYFFFKIVVLRNFPYHTPVQIPELFVGLLTVLLIAFIMIGSQTLKAARSNPVAVLKSE